MSAPAYGCDGNGQRYRYLPDEDLIPAGECACPSCLNWLIGQNPPKETTASVLQTDAAW